MRLTPEKVLHLSERIANALDLADDDESICIKSEEDDVRMTIRVAINQFLQRDEQAQERVKSKIRSMRRGIPEGSAEWDALFRQFMDEEMGKLRKVR